VRTSLNSDAARFSTREPSDTRPACPGTISSRTCLDATGMGWAWCRRFAAANGVPCWRVGERKVVIPLAPLMAAVERVAARIGFEVVAENEVARGGPGARKVRAG
jgi:hypothetical protein